MDVEFQNNLASWSAYSEFVGTAAATLLGLLFVAVSLRLNIFRDDATADVRVFAQLTLLSLLSPLVLSGLALMPHDQPLMLAVPIVFLAVAGLYGVYRMLREWIRLNPMPSRTPGYQPWQWQGWVHMCLLAAGYLGLGVVTLLLLQGRGSALLVLSIVEGWMLLIGTLNAWVMLANAGAASNP